MQGDRVRFTVHQLVAIVLMLIAAAPAAAEDDFAGSYALSGVGADHAAYGGTVAITKRNFAYDVGWQFDDRAPQSGFALTLNHVLGVAFWPEGVAPEPETGLVLYRIDGGTLDGIWLPSGATERTPGREVLNGSPDLSGRYQIALGVNPGGRSRYTGYADFERSGDHVKIVWHAPRQVFLGTGVRLGAVLVVAYAYERFPAVAAFCSNGYDLRGVWWGGPEGSSGRETLTPATPDAAQLPSTRNANPRDPCSTPIAANF